MKPGRFWLVWAAILAVVLIAALAAPLLVQASPTHTRPAEQFTPPGAAFPFGSDQFGRDMLSRTLYGARSSLSLAVLSTFVAIVIGTAVGGLSGTMGGPVDWLLMRLVDVLLAFPGLLLAMVLVATLGGTPLTAALAVGFSLSPAYSRYVRSAILSVRSQPYIEAARVQGAGLLRLVRVHMLPNIAGELIAFATVIYAWSLLNMASLDFLALSGSPEVATLGRLLSDGRSYLRVAPWIAIAPGVILTLAVLSTMGLSDAWRRGLPGQRS